MDIALEDTFQYDQIKGAILKRIHGFKLEDTSGYYLIKESIFR